VQVHHVVAPRNLKEFEALIRQRTAAVLDNLPEYEPFDWVKLVSRDLTTKMLATLFDYPWEERSHLTEWSDMFTSDVRITAGGGATREVIIGHMSVCLQRFTELWHERKGDGKDAFDLIRMLQTDPNTANMVDDPLTYLGNIILLIVGGNDTTRNSMSGGVVFLDQFPGEMKKVRVRGHLSFGAGIHRCMGNRLAEMQLRILWEEALKRFKRIELAGEPERTCNLFIRGFTKLPVRVARF
jgi:cytochrome P450